MSDLNWKSKFQQKLIYTLHAMDFCEKNFQ